MRMSPLLVQISLAPKANGGGSAEPGAASVVLTWSWASADKWAAGGVAVRP